MRRHRLPLAGFLPIFALVLAGPSLVLAAPSRTQASAPELPKLKLPAGASPTGYAVELSIDPAKQDFKGSVAIELRLKDKTSFLWLNATALEVTKASVLVGDQ